jgi:hypothetical protein
VEAPGSHQQDPPPGAAAAGEIGQPPVGACQSRCDHSARETRRSSDVEAAAVGNVSDIDNFRCAGVRNTVSF